MPSRKQLIDYIESFHPSQWPHSIEIADALIKEGFCKVDEPREFWIVKDLGGAITCHTERPTYAVDSTGRGLEVIHVREVVEE